MTLVRGRGFILSKDPRRLLGALEPEKPECDSHGWTLGGAGLWPHEGHVVMSEHAGTGAGLETQG